jgi:hypothetical protein
MTELIIEKGKLEGVKYLWKIKAIEVDIVTLVKYKIQRNMSMLDENKEVIILDEMIGEEKHKCYPHIILQIGGKVGEVLKSFEIEQKGKSIKVSKVEWI